MSVNEITGDSLRSKKQTENYENGYELAFGEKKVVHYRDPERNAFIEVDLPAWIKNVDHPLFKDGDIIRTTRITSYDKVTGNFETKNTKYVRVD